MSELFDRIYNDAYILGGAVFLIFLSCSSVSVNQVFTLTFIITLLL